MTGRIWHMNDFWNKISLKLIKLWARPCPFGSFYSDRQFDHGDSGGIVSNGLIGRITTKFKLWMFFPKGWKDQYREFYPIPLCSFLLRDSFSLLKSELFFEWDDFVFFNHLMDYSDHHPREIHRKEAVTNGSEIRTPKKKSVVSEPN